MNCTIESIQAQNFRGIRHLRLPVEGRNLIVVGENGAGKSSIVDAIQYFFTGRVEPLEGRGDVDKRQSIPNLQGGLTEVGLRMKGVFPETGVPLPYPQRGAAIPDSVKPLLDLASRRAFVLRRSQVLRFINARDAKRYEEISQLIGLGRLDRMDDCWRGERNSAQKSVRDLRANEKGILNRLSELLNTEIRREYDIIREVNTQLVDLDLDPIVERDELPHRKETLKRHMRIGTDVTKAERLQSLQEHTERITQKIAEASSQYEELEEKMRKFWAQSQILEDAPFELLLTEGFRILQAQPELSKCPLCKERFRDRSAILADLHQRVQELQDLAQSRRRIGELETLIRDNLLLLGGSLDSLHRGLESQGMTLHLPVIQKAHREVRRRQRRLEKSDRRTGADREWHENRAIAELQNVLPQLKESIIDQVRVLAPTEAEKTALDWLVTMTRVDEQWQMLHRKAEELQKARHVSQQINLVYDELVAARKRGLERLSQDLEEGFNRLYQQLHPDEGYQAISIPVQHGQRSSVALRARFHDQDESHPLSYYSEGHLDSLGLCIFLAFIKRFNQDLKLIVLDDVLTTVDAGHRLRVARLLAREFSDYQLVITTHDQLWANELKSTIPNAKLVQLRRWTLGQGVDYQDNVLSDWDYYAQQAEEGRPQDTIGGAGRNLEKFLYQMRVNLGLAIPAKQDGVYTIGDLYGPFWGWVHKYQIERPDRPDFAQELRELNTELDEVWRLRNWSGAHFNTWAETVSCDEALDFLYSIERLVTSFECPVCENLVVYRNSARALICPRCQPCPPPKAACEYDPGWLATSAKLLGATKPTVRQQAAGLAQSACLAFLRDMRRRLNLPVMATPNDEYGVAELYVPFFDWAMTHPLKTAGNWSGTIEQRREALDAFLQSNQWIEVLDSEIEPFVDAVRRLTAVFECDACCQLLSYDHDQRFYFCPDCSELEAIRSSMPAYWFVRKD